MDVGDYVRTKWGCIAKFEGIHEGFYEFDNIIMDESSAVKEELFVDIVEKSSQNIIDLIRCGDVLIVKEYCDEVCQIFTEIYLIQSDDQLLNIKEDLEKNKNHKLYSILTKEMFEQMEYKIQ